MTSVPGVERPDILYEDGAIIVVHKPAYIAVQSGRVGEQDMASLLKNYLHSTYVGVIHRLDKPVEGILVFGKNKTASAVLSRQVREHIFNKRYDAISVVTADGIADSGRLEDYIIADSKNNISRIANSETAGAKKAILDYHVIGSAEAGRQTLAHVKIELYTGRHHQIRLQLAHAGLPILGDRKYGGLGCDNDTPLCLTATELGFIHPATGEKMEFKIGSRIMAEFGFDKFGEDKENIIADI